MSCRVLPDVCQGSVTFAHATQACSFCRRHCSDDFWRSGIIGCVILHQKLQWTQDNMVEVVVGDAQYADLLRAAGVIQITSNF